MDSLRLKKTMNLKTSIELSFSGKLILLLLVFTFSGTDITFSAESTGVIVTLEDYDGPATVSVESLERFKVEIHIDRKTDRNPLALVVQLPNTGRKTWPFYEVVVLDSSGQAVSVKRAGIAWHKLWITAPANQSDFVIRAVNRPSQQPKTFPEKDRYVSDTTTGLSAMISLWPDGREAALSLRFDDSHPTHLTKVIPILREYGFKGTFMVNPGGRDEHSANSRSMSAFQRHLSEWKAVAKRGDQEFANHTAHHRGAKNNAEMESEIGDAAKVIWELFPNKSKLHALNLGGGTYWETSRPLRYYLDKYHAFDVSGSLGMDDVYGNRVQAFRQHIERHVERKLWARVHFHDIGDNHGSSEEHFRAAMDIAKEHETKLWIAGMADIYKYQTERRAATLALEESQPGAVTLRLSCSTRPKLFDQALTIELSLPKSWARSRVIVLNAGGKQITTRERQQEGADQLLFNVPPTNGRFSITRNP